ncbi:hypothetical protein HDV00_012565 [Rhizophlyctis rosea]|nr:hypothetical protein HDV00_012565 [Rhizophlyctis rosea]
MSSKLEPYQKLVGKQFAPSAKEVINLVESGVEDDKIFTKDDLPQPSRVLYPGDMMTAEYVEDRLNVHVNDDGVVQQVTLG